MCPKLLASNTGSLPLSFSDSVCLQADWPSLCTGTRGNIWVSGICTFLFLCARSLLVSILGPSGNPVADVLWGLRRHSFAFRFRFCCFKSWKLPEGIGTWPWQHRSLALGLLLTSDASPFHLGVGIGPALLAQVLCSAHMREQ